LSSGNSNATSQICLRCLRHIFRRAIKSGYISEAAYPFKDYTIGSTSRSKDVLYPEQLKALYEYKPRNYAEKRSKDYFFFLYLCNGLNLKDALLLKGSNVRGKVITFIRAKTALTQHDTKPITIYLHPEARRIIEAWGDMKTNDYLFPCMRGSKNDVERKHLKDIFARNLNRYLRPIGKKLGFEMNLTLNLARHSFATRLKLDGTPTSFIGEILGHSNSSTTEHYLKSLPTEKYKSISESLLNFDRTTE
jgi:integrase